MATKGLTTKMGVAVFLNEKLKFVKNRGYEPSELTKIDDEAMNLIAGIENPTEKIEAEAKYSQLRLKYLGYNA